MGYAYRNVKRRRAHYILGVLYKKYNLELIEGQHQTYALLVDIVKQKGYKDIRYFLKSYESKEDHRISNEAVHSLLIENGHIEKIGHAPSELTKLLITSKGIDAYKENFYGVENGKDFLAEVELRTKWIIPFITIVLSFAAFCLSLYSYYHPHK